MSGPACCILGVCCRKGSDQVRALAEYVQARWPEVQAETEMAPGRAAALIILGDFDLVPKGLGVAAVNAYEPFFREFFKEKGNAE